MCHTHIFPSVCIYACFFNPSHLIEQKGDFLEQFFLPLERTVLKDLGNSWRHLPSQEHSSCALWGHGGRPARAELALGDC